MLGNLANHLSEVLLMSLGLVECKMPMEDLLEGDLLDQVKASRSCWLGESEVWDMEQSWI